MVCVLAEHLFIPYGTTWKALDPSALDRVVDTTTIGAIWRKPILVGQLDIELTLEKRIVDWFGGVAWHAHTSKLTDDAFVPKTYTISLEKGNFALPILSSPTRFDRGYMFRLSFDRSPYPPRNEWTGRFPEDQLTKLREVKAFVGRSLGELLRQAILFSWLGNCVVS